MEGHLSSVECMLVRETMLRQEKIYREQVQALHYLYEVQKSMMDELGATNLSGPNGNPPQHHQFFPLKEEPTKTGFPKGFDLEKLPDENVDQELDLKPCPTDVNCDLELFLHCGSMKRPRLDYSDMKSHVQSFSVGQKERQATCLQKNHQQWLLEGIGNNNQASASGFFQLQMPNGFAQAPLHGWEDSKNSSGRFASTGFPTPAVVSSREQDGRTGLWYGHQQAGGMQQNMHATPHPWQVSGTAYFNGLAASHLPVTWDGLVNGSSGSLFSLATKRYADSSQQQADRNGQLKNGYENTMGLNYYVTIPGVKKDSNGIVGGNTYRDTIGTKAACKVETMFTVFEGQQNSYWANASSAGNGNLTGSQARPPEKDKAAEEKISEDEVASLAASILLSLTLDKTPCNRKESSPSLKDSVAWFADAIPAEAGVGMDVEEDGGGSSPEIDHFECATLQLKAIDESEHVPVSRVEQEPVARSGHNTKPSTTSTGRPTRSSKKQRDFRNDTLPSITSLSRQEITEDWQIMSGLLRSSDGATSAGGGSRVDPSTNASRRSGKFCNISRLEGSSNSRMTSPVSTLDHYSSPSKASRRSSSVPPAAAAAAASPGGGGAALPWLVRWGETRRKRKQRQRSATPMSQKLKLFASSSRTRR
ncbi:hypothetical protein SELMODRAFT_438604 [Selaginella moellendorffii]|uniref:Uncharacterized protein n=1 Tax=Selaginella moellendorffii TaxID=88036 RepID=D8QX06_SELML|nr:uncharacterized protein LOC9643666 [Selaginella moellendorffii]EFJ35731.1 hypothetical protein SELMODRAFT_438604 [Selaginella moellendorffii]|eukprot:XP_002963860.1 uncharacterized protein LOC9643666 [Selaginella moellendorffii]